VTAEHPQQTTFEGRDPARVAASAISVSSPTKCQARTRLYQHGNLELAGFPVTSISDYLRDESSVVWLDLRDPDREDLAVISDEFSLHPLAVEDAVTDHERPKLDRYRTHLFITAYAVRLDAGTGQLATSELSAFITERALITVRKDDGLDIGTVIGYWDASPDLAKFGVGYLLHGLIDYMADGYLAAAQPIGDTMENLGDQLFSDTPQDRDVQRRGFEVRKSLVLLRRVVLPMREVVSTLMRRDPHIVGDVLQPYYQDVYDHVLRATEETDSLVDMLRTILETNITMQGNRMTMQGNRMNVITKKVTGWAAIIAVPTFITGLYGMNVPYPGFAREWGVIFSVALMLASAAVLYVVFRRKDWL
jgi:magnesium transporter